MEWVETTGRTVAEALDAALDMLGVHEDDVEFEVLAEPKSGLFGRFGGSDARIRARVKPVSREKPHERRRRRARGERTRERGGPGGGERPGGEKPARPARAKGRGEAAPRRPERPRSAAEHEGVTMEREETPEPAALDEQEQTAGEFVRGLVGAFGLRAEVNTKIDDDTVLVGVEGEGLGLLIGPRGATLGAIEELTRAVVQRSTAGSAARVIVDVTGYREKRRAALEAYARELAHTVLEDGTEQVLEPMSSADRKAVHDAVAEIDGVETLSEGEDPRRYVVIRRR